MAERVCARPECTRRFEPYRPMHKFCSTRCGTMEAKRRWRAVAANAEGERKKQKRWYRKSGRGKREAYYRQKGHVYTAVQRALRAGTLRRQPCEVCGDEQVDAHHEDYSKPLDVVWLCRKHHRAVHAGEVALSLARS